MLQVRDIRFSYSDPVLRGVSFEVGEGRMLAVLGPNGSGKSTLLKTIVGILSPSSGSVLVDGRDLTTVSRRESARLLGYVAQESAVRFPLTAMEFVLQGRFAQGRLVGFESDEDEREADRAMELTETTSLASRVVTELSGGERQRVMLARALASRPRLLVLDEPVANLDISHQVKMLDQVSQLVADEAMSAVVVTHELNLAAEFATEVLLLKAGEAMAFGKPAHVLSEEQLRSVFDTDVIVDVNPRSGAPRITLVRPSL
jgi:iron complex transport system ATP-binding protein